MLADLVVEAWSSSTVVLVSADCKFAPAVSLLGAQHRDVVTISHLSHLFKIGAKKRLSWKSDILCLDDQQDVSTERNCSHVDSSVDYMTKGGIFTITVPMHFSFLRTSHGNSHL